MKKYVLSLITLLCISVGMSAQSFFNLTASEVKIDSLLPTFTYQFDLGRNYADSVYTVEIVYPEFIDMTPTDVARYRLITDEPLPELPVVNQYIAVDRKQGKLCISFVPLVMRDGRYQKLVSFMLSVNAQAVSRTHALRRAAETASRYADHSVLASGRWVRISIPETGIYQLTNSLIREAGFDDLSKVKVYGYGGALQPEQLTGDYLTATDDLKEVPTCTIDGHRLFFATGPVNWSAADSKQRLRNPYSTKGYYFLTESDADPLTIDEATFRSNFSSHPNNYHSLIEPEEFSWYHGGRNLYERTPLSSTARNYAFNAHQSSATLLVTMTYNGYCEAEVTVNGAKVGSLTVNATTVSQDVSYFTNSSHSYVAAYTWKFELSNLNIGENTVSLTKVSGTNTNMRLDQITVVYSEARAMPDVATAPEPTIENVVSNQDHHADERADMIIIIPSSLKLKEQATRLKQHHEQADGLSVRVVPADELYNEFSSGTPDANAYRRYLKMFYDRAENDADIPRFLLLLGDCAWDNRMLGNDWNSTSPEDFLLCYESENSFSEVYCYVSDDYFCLLDDNERIDDYMGKPDVAVGRIPVRTAAEAEVVVDKTIGYANNEYAGYWQNTLCFMGDDGDNNQHMECAEEAAELIRDMHPAMNIKKVYWDAYNRVSSSTGNGYPDVTRLLKQQMREGALIMNYSGHGAAYCLSHEQVLRVNDFAEATSMHLPLWVTASCDIAPYDGQVGNIGETALLNKKGGAIAFYGTPRTVFLDKNKIINRVFMKHVLSVDEATGKRITLGEANRLTKNELVTSRTNSDTSVNKLNYVLLGDPALSLAFPTLTAKIDSINGQPIDGEAQKLSSGSVATVSGHIVGHDNFNGVATISISDVEEQIVCKRNNGEEIAMTYLDRPSTIYNGSDSVANGRFKFTFAVPRDISYSENSGCMLVYAINNEKNLSANGRQEGFMMSGTEDKVNDGIGPSIYCYLNTRSFCNGDVVNNTPYFYAEISDIDGINAAGSGIGHDLELIIDGDLARTYILNSYFRYNFGDYSSGTVGYSLPELEDGPHKLMLRAWDVLNNSSTAELNFTVDPQLEPQVLNIVCTRNPTNTNTRFLITHDRTGSQMDVTLEIFDASGRILWAQTESGVPTDETYTIDWNLTGSHGGRLRPGIYLYRVLVSSNGSREASRAQKLIITK